MSNRTRDLRVFEIGKIVNVDTARNTYNVATSFGKRLEGVKPAWGGSNPAGGSVEIWFPEVGSFCLLYNSNGQNYIAGIIPGRGISPLHHSSIHFTNINQISEEDIQVPETGKGYSYRGNMPPDFRQGDWARIDNEGAFVSVLRGGVATMGSGATNRVMFLDHDDICRMMTRNYDHFTDGTEQLIYNDEGEINSEFYFTSMDFEAKGENAVGQDITVHEPSDGKPRIRLKDPDKMAKWKGRVYMGWLGDLFHIFVTKRPEEDKRLDKNTPPGMAEIFIGADGAIRTRSVREIVSEKVSRIRVPKKIREAFHNEKGDAQSTGYVPTPHEVYQWDTANPGGRALQHLEWWAQQVDHEETRHFRDHNKDWNVKSIFSTAEPGPPKDIYDGSEEPENTTRTSYIKQRDNGSIVLEDAWGSTIEMTGGDIIIHARRDVKILSGRDNNVMAGRDVTTRAHENWDAVAHTGAARLKGHSQAWVFGDTGPATVESASGDVCMISRKENVLIRAERKDVRITSDLKKIDLVAIEDEIRLRAKKELKFISDEEKIQFFTDSDFEVLAKEKIKLLAGDTTPPSMTANERDCGEYTDTTMQQDNGNTGSVSDPTFIEIDGSGKTIKAKAETSIQMAAMSEIKLQSGFDQAMLKLDSSKYILWCVGEARIKQERDLQLRKIDSGGDENYQKRTPENPGSAPESDGGPVEGPKADEYKINYAEGRFRWRLEAEHREDQDFYEPIWQHMGPGELDFTRGAIDWVELLQEVKSEQDVPDIGFERPIVGDQQECNTSMRFGGDREQLYPFGRWKRYEDGQYSWDSSITPGTFMPFYTVRIPRSWQQPEDDPIERLHVKPPGTGSESDESFQGDLDLPDSENPQEDTSQFNQ